MFDQLGGLEGLVRGKTVTVKLNMTGAPAQRVQGLPPGVTHYTHPKVVGAVAYLMGRAGARRIRFVESAWATGGPLEEVMLDSGWNVRSLKTRGARAWSSRTPTRWARASATRASTCRARPTCTRLTT